MLEGWLAIFSLFLGVDSAVLKDHTPPHDHQRHHHHHHHHPTTRFVTYHKTGSVLANSVLKACIPEAGIELDIHGKFNKKSTVHFVRDPAAIVRSAYEYHRDAKESWLFEPAHHYHVIKDDRKLLEWYNQSEGYQAFLNRVPMWLGVRAEFLRCTSEMDAMLANAAKCQKQAKECKQVCLEQFTASTQSYLATWKKVLDFLKLGHSAMHCIKGFDMLNPDYRGSATHSTTKKKLETAKINSWFASLDHEFTGGAYREGDRLLGCARNDREHPGFRYTRSRSDVSTKKVEDAYA